MGLDAGSRKASTRIACSQYRNQTQCLCCQAEVADAHSCLCQVLRIPDQGAIKAAHVLLIEIVHSNNSIADGPGTCQHCNAHPMSQSPV